MSVLLEVPCTEHAEQFNQVRAEGPGSLGDVIDCAVCKQQHPLHAASLTPAGGLLACVACAHHELYRQKNFPRSIGIGMVVVAAVLAPFTHYISLGVAALVDALLYWLGPDVLICYVCHARHSGFNPDPRHPAFDREIEERLKFGERAVMGKPMREGGTAGAPEPEH